MSVKVCQLSQQQRREYERTNQKPACDEHTHVSKLYRDQAIARGEAFPIAFSDGSQGMGYHATREWRTVGQTSPRHFGPGLPVLQFVEVG